MKGDNLQELVEFVAQSLVDQPAKVNVEKQQRGNTVQLDLHVAKEDMGRVIGKGGRVANSIRTLLNVAAAREGSRANLDIVEPS
ncbi:MAG: KH domain-containing protein [Brevefilum sp.]|nr:KH domain-containing protein [Brevefilum sp.]MDT8382423.1 KH domain-containing protein [Brevefilum sp.]MDW7755372.1 KH domain-containing protein [Brevefilum sp.]